MSQKSTKPKATNKFDDALRDYVQAMKHLNWVRAHHRIKNKYGHELVWQVEKHCLSKGITYRDNQGRVILDKEYRYI